MNLKDRIIDGIVNAAIRLAPSSKIVAEYHNRKQGKRLGYDRQVLNMQSKTLSDWKMALMGATDPENPTRGELMRFYLNNLMLDDHLGSVIETRSLAVQQAPFIVVDKNNKENEQLKELLMREWMLDAMDFHVFSEFQGTTLLEMYDINPLTGELEAINEIPQSNFCAPKSLFLKQEYDPTGIDYKSPAYYPYYAQIRDDWYIGMLNQLAPIVLAKKLGLGAWLSYIDKYGVPPIFAITDRMDTARRDEMFEMLENFRMNHFAVLQGNERIEIPSNYNVDAYNTFEALHKLGDRCISKRVLGQTGTTDEKSFVGSAQVHEKVAKSRHDADKLRFTYYFNNEIRPRLIKLSSVYSAFETHTLKFDNSARLEPNEYVEGVAKLSPYYIFDVKEIAQKTGLPLTDVKTNVFEFNQTPNPPAEKTTANQQPTIQAYSEQPNLSAWNFNSDITAIDLSGWEEVMQQIAQKIHSGEIKASDITPQYVSKLNTTLRDAVSRGLTKNLNTINYNEPDFEILQDLQQNIFNFSCAKNFTMQQHINSLLIDSEGNRRTWQQFENEVRNLGVEYNKNYLKVEWQAATQSAQAVRDWQYYNEIADIYPNLKVMPTSAKEPRESHQPLEGMVLPVTHVWWQKNGLPPWDWGCKHRVEPVKEQADDTAPNVPINPVFAHNVAESGEIFTGKHPYFSMSTKLFEDLRQGSELAKEYADYNKIYQNGNGKVLNSIFADKKDFANNFETAKIIADNLGETIRIRPHINLHGVKNPEYLIKNEFAERKGIKELKNGINNAIKEANKQGCSRCIIDFNEHNVELDIIALARNLKSSVNNRNKLIKEAFIVKGDKAIKLTRAEMQASNLTELLKRLKGE